MKVILTTFLSCLFFNAVYAQVGWNVAYLKQGKGFMGAVTMGNEVFFAGGQYLTLAKTTLLDSVEIFNLTTGNASYDRLSKARSHIKAITASGKIFFAGGIDSIAAGGNARPSDIVDIYDSLTGNWTVHQLSQARFDIEAAVVGDKIVFAGGKTDSSASDVVDIYDLTTGDWSVQHLSMPTFGMGVAVAGTKVFFAGGFDGSYMQGNDYGWVRKQIDIYDSLTDTWSIDSLSEARCYIGGAHIGDKLMFAGGSKGTEMSNRVDVFDLTSSAWSIDSLSVGRCLLNTNVTTQCNQVYFIGGDCINVSSFLLGIFCNYNSIDIYNEDLNAWSTDTLPYGLKWHSVLSTNHQLIVAGGISSPWWQPSTFHDEILTRDCSISSTQDIKDVFIRAYPNPTTAEIILEAEGIVIKQVLLINLSGQTMRSFIAGETINLVGLPSGMYLMKVLDSEKKIYFLSVAKL